MGRGVSYRRIMAALALAALGVVATGWRVSAQNVVLSGTATSMGQEQQSLKEARRQANDARIRSERLEAQATVAGAQADRARALAAALAARIQESEADIRAGQARIAIITRLQRVQAAGLAQKQQPIIRLTAALQTMARRPSVLVLLQPGSITDAVHVRAVLATVLPVIDARTAGLRADLARSRQLRAMAETAARAMQTSRTKLATQQGQLRRIETEKRLAARGLTSDATLEGDRAMAMGEKARDIVDLMARLEQAGDVRERLAMLPGPELRPAQPGSIADPQADSSTASDRAPAYRLPVVGALVTGMGEMSDSGVRARGLTVAAQPMAQVIAPAAGHVAFAEYYRGFRQIIIIDHGQGWTTLLTNLGRLSVSVGDSVMQGDPVGTAATANPNITVELRRKGRPVDILALMSAR
ncbi:MAG: peptidoglycan DD-metalloendopeptidase family protein [Sphingobium sp.]